MKIIKSVPYENLYFQESIIEDGNVNNVTEVGIINLYDEIEYQTVLGFGGAFTESAAYNYALMSDKNKKLFLKSYFDDKNGIGYNLHNGYGMSEIGITSVELRRKAAQRNQNAVGKPFDSVEYRLDDPGIPPGKIITSDGRHGPKLVEALNSPNAISATTGMRFELVTILSS